MKTIKNKILFGILFGIILISFTTSSGFKENQVDCSFIDTFKLNDTITLWQTCSDCTFVNITSVIDPEGIINILNEQMTKTGTFYNYSYSDTSKKGKYFYNVLGDKDSLNKTETLCFEITRNGTKINQSESLIYFILAFGVFLLFIISFYFMIVTPYSNKKDEDGAVIQISKLKYVKIGLILLTWVLFTWFLNILIGLSDNFVSLDLYYGFFGFIFELMNNLALPLGIFMLVLAGFEIIRDTNIHEQIKKFGSSKR